jgi:hypothetical protein
MKTLIALALTCSAAILKADYDKWGPAIRASGFKPTQ